MVQSIFVPVEAKNAWFIVVYGIIVSIFVSTIWGKVHRGSSPEGCPGNSMLEVLIRGAGPGIVLLVGTPTGVLLTFITHIILPYAPPLIILLVYELRKIHDKGTGGT